MRNLSLGLSLIAMVSSAAIFGFFYAWVCSTMWGLDAAAPDIAISAMQAMNASVRNLPFAISFFGTVPFMFLAAAACVLANARRAGGYFALGGGIYLFGAMVLTMTVNVPMNEALAEVAVGSDQEVNRKIWAVYSADWQFWNITRTGFSGLAVLCAAAGLFQLGKSDAGCQAG